MFFMGWACCTLRSLGCSFVAVLSAFARNGIVQCYPNGSEYHHGLLNYECYFFASLKATMLFFTFSEFLFFQKLIPFFYTEVKVI